MFSVLISRRAVSCRPHCVYLEKQNKIVCIIRSATRAALEGSPAGSFRLQRAPAAVDPQPLARPTTTSSHWDGLWGAQMCSLPTDASPTVLQLHMGLFPRDEAKGWSGCPLQSLPGQEQPHGQDQAPTKWPQLPICSSPESGCSCITPSFPPAWPQSKAGMFSSCVSVGNLPPSPVTSPWPGILTELPCFPQTLQSQGYSHCQLRLEST